MHSKFFTNKDENTLFNKFSGIFEHNKNINNFDVLVGYFRSSGYFKLRPHLEKVANIRILVGIDVDKLTQDSHALGLVYQENKEAIEKSWQAAFVADIQYANYDETTEQGIKQFITDMLSGKVQLKAHPSQKIHAKIYIFRPDNFNKHTASSVITGSSNLTDAGLGTQKTANYEFNVLLNDYAEVQFATEEFEKLWAEGMDILPTTAEKSLNKTHLSDSITPYELYLKCLIEYFGEQIDAPTIDDLPKEFVKLSYQADAVHQGYLLLKKHNGFFLADVVGLGKTMIATLIAKKFWHNSNRDCRILVVTPPAIKPNWEDTFKTFKLNANYEIITNGSLDKVEENKYDLVIVDEAHKFRNDQTYGYTALQKICKKITVDDKNKISVQQSNVILISATPLNNKPDDIFNQVLLFQDKNQTTLDISLGHYFEKYRSEYQEISTQENNTEKVKALYEKIREKIIEPLTVRRTRTDLTSNERYKKDLGAQKIKFPKINAPQPIYYKLKKKLNTLFDETLKKINPSTKEEEKGEGLLYTRYQAVHFLSEAKKKNYPNAEAMAIGLKGIMKTLLLKRMDSSFYAFNKTLNAFLASSQAMLDMINDNKIIISKDKKIRQYIADGEVEKIEALDKKEGKDYLECTIEDFKPGFKESVEHDHKILQELVKDWGANKLDPKIDEFKKQLPELLNKEKNPEQKLVIFSESADTMGYLSEKLNDYSVLSVSGENRDRLKNTIKENFDANLNPNSKENDFQIIITTDVLAEGVNLHRANTIVNYDTPWNATRLMQRIGRVNRIGSVADNIFIHNFLPTAKIDDAIALRKNAHTKMQGFHSALGEDSQIYSTDEETGTFAIFDEQNDEIDERLVFLEEIKQFKKDNPKDYENIKKLPNKLRNTVKNKAHQNGTLSFIRTQNNQSSRFYYVDNQALHEWTFIKSATLLRCNKNANAEKYLPKTHYPQVNNSIKQFNTEQTRIIVNQEQNNELSKKDITAINALKTLLKTDNKEQKQVITSGITLIELGTYQQLPREINALFKKQRKSILTIKEVTEKALEIIQKYIQETPTETELTQENGKDTTPTVVISQSYV